jgi:hypothetical protein
MLLYEFWLNNSAEETFDRILGGFAMEGKGRKKAVLFRRGVSFDLSYDETFLYLRLTDWHIKEIWEFQICVLVQILLRICNLQTDTP